MMSVEHKVERFELDGGRQIGVHTLAEGNGERTVVLCHPAPGAASFDPDPAETWKRGVTLLAVDRPGYDQSDPVSNGWATVGQAADDIAAVLDRAGLGPVGVAGWSAGGRVSLALAARHPDLVDRVVVLGTPAPHEEVPWIPDEIAQGIEALRGLPAAEIHTALAGQFEQMLPEDSRSANALHLLGSSPADDAAIEGPGARDRLEKMLQSAFTQGVTGMVQDIAGFTFQPWGFEPDEVRAKTLLLYGSADPIAAQRHASWWQTALPDARVEMVPGAGHLLILSHWKRALSHLAPGSKR